ncbi:MAG: PAS domain-containing protein [Pseudomonadota bacterium]
MAALRRFWDRMPFIGRLLVTASIALVVAGAAMVVLSARQESREVGQDLQAVLERELETLPSALAEIVVLGDFSTLQQTLDRYVARPQILFVEYHDVDGTILQSRDGLQEHRAPAWFMDLFGFHDVVGQTRVEVGGRVYGSLHLGLTSHGLADRAWFHLNRHLQILLLAIILDFIGIWLVLRQGLAPLKRLEEGTRALAAGRYDVQLEPEGSTELRSVIDAFNAMAQSVRRGNDALGQSQERLLLAIEGVNDGVWDWDIRTNTTYFSTKWKEMVGYDDHELVNNYQTFEALLHPDDLARVRAAIAGYLEGRDQVYSIEFRFRHKDGSWRWILARGEALRDAEGKPYRMAGSHTDITERKRQEAELLEQRRRLEDIIEGTRAGTWEWHVQTGEVTFNERWAEIVGYTLEELAPVTIDTWLKLAHPEDLERSAVALEQHFSGASDSYEIEARMRHKAGHWVWVLDRGKVSSRAPDGTPLLMSGTHQDISLRKQAEARMQEAEQLLRSSIEVIGEAFVIYGPDDRLVYCNDEYRAFYRISAPSIQVGARFEDIIRYGVAHGQYKEAIGREEAWVEERMSIHRQAVGELVQELEDGRVLKVRERRTPSGHIVGFRVDVTELYQAKEAAEAANVAKSRFLATMSHEIRTPMNGILGMAQILMQPELGEGERRDYARTILHSGESLLSLLNDILDLSKVEAGRLELDPEAMDPAQVLHEVHALFSESSSRKGLVLEETWHGARRQYLADAHRLFQMLSNLVSNAIKFTHKGQVRLEGRILDEDETGGVLEFVVVDSGIGLAPEVQAQLFQPFIQGDASTSRNFGGTGLGLSIVRSLAQLMGGEVGVESAPGAGARFWFRVPVARVKGEASAPQRQAKAPDSGRASLTGKVLLVDDDATNRKVARIMLGKLGIVPHMAEDGLEAVDMALAGHGQDLILMDMHMPGMDGLEATRRIRDWEASQGLPRRPIIALTADAFPQEHKRCLEAGMDDVLVKPVTLGSLEAALGKWLVARIPAGNPASGAGAPAVPAPAPSDSAPDWARIGHLLAALEPLLKAHRFDALATYKQLVAAVAGTPLETPVAEAGKALEALQFDQAWVRLHGLAAQCANEEAVQHG